MFYRRKIILALLEIFENKLEKIRFQKLLFLFSKLELKPNYEFIPYKYGCFSYSANADLNAMSRLKLICEDDNYIEKIDCNKYIKELKEEDQIIIKTVKERYGSMSKDNLIKHTYINYPYYTINSLIADKYVPKTMVENTKELYKESSTILYTIGYQGITLEHYINKLIKNNIRVLIDVRKNALSQKYGFSKKTLKNVCNSVNIEYLHIPDLGINSDKRHSLNTQKDYDLLFEEYKATILKKNTSSQDQVLKLLKKYKRVALTCFESNICQCHRKPLSESIAKLHDLKVMHI